MRYPHCWLLAAVLITAPACKRSADPSPQAAIEAPAITRMNKTFVQGGDTLTLYGSHLKQQDSRTTVSLNGRPAEILRQAVDSLVIRIPDRTLTGRILITISAGDQFKSVYGPAVEVKPTPVVHKFYPLFAYAGDTIQLIAEHFSEDDKDNSINLNGLPAGITGRKGKDTLLVKLPANASSGVFTWSAYHGPLHKGQDTFSVRKPQYPVNTLTAWLLSDPAFTFIGIAIRDVNILAASNMATIYNTMDTLDRYVNHADRRYTIFLPTNRFYTDQGISLEQYKQNVIQRVDLVYFFLLAAVVPNEQLHIADLQDGEEYQAAFTSLNRFYPLGDESQHNRLRVFRENGEVYIGAISLYGDYVVGSKVKILREHHFGNVSLIETEGEVGNAVME